MARRAGARKVVGVLAGLLLGAGPAAGCAGLPGPGMAGIAGLPGLPGPRTTPPPRPAGMAFEDAAIEALVLELEAASPAAARLLAEVRRSLAEAEYGVRWGRPDQLRRETAEASPGWRAPGNLGWVAVKRGHRRWWEVVAEPVWAEWIVVVIDLEAHERVWRAAAPSAEPGLVEREALSLVAHELVHLHSVVAAGGDTRAMCADAAPGELVWESCLERRLGPIREELGLWTWTAVRPRRVSE